MRKVDVWESLREHLATRDERQHQREISMRRIKDDLNFSEQMVNCRELRHA